VLRRYSLYSQLALPCGRCTAKLHLVKKLPAVFTPSEDYSEAFTLLPEGLQRFDVSSPREERRPYHPLQMRESYQRVELLPPKKKEGDPRFVAFCR